MIELGAEQKLVVVKKEDFGVYLGETRDAERDARVLLPKKLVPEGTEVGSELSVFIYRDSSDRIIATTLEPKIYLHGLAVLQVKEVSKNGAFLDWGLEKDLLLPYHEQTRKVAAGDEVLVALYVDKSSRLAATMKVYEYLRTDSPYKTGDRVSGRVYQRAENFGTFVAVDDMYSGMIPKREMQKQLKIGEVLSFRVTHVKEDGKLDLSLREKAYLQIDIDADSILSIINEDYKGSLPFDDKAGPEEIKDVFGLSKASFKRAVGHLYKQHKIELKDGRILAVRESVSQK